MSLKPQDQRIDRAPKLEIIRREKLSAIKDRNNPMKTMGNITLGPKMNSLLEQNTFDVKDSEFNDTIIQAKLE